MSRPVDAEELRGLLAEGSNTSREIVRLHEEAKMITSGISMGVAATVLSLVLAAFSYSSEPYSALIWLVASVSEIALTAYIVSTGRRARRRLRTIRYEPSFAHVRVTSTMDETGSAILRSVEVGSRRWIEATPLESDAGLAEAARHRIEDELLEHELSAGILRETPATSDPVRREDLVEILEASREAVDGVRAPVLRTDRGRSLRS